jgi:hypothetical protein
MEKLVDWPKILFDFREMVRKVDLPATNRHVPRYGSTTFRLLRMVAHNEWTRVLGNVEGNVLVAALHIACMKELDFTRDSFPDIPEKFGRIAER